MKFCAHFLENIHKQTSNLFTTAEQRKEFPILIMTRHAKNSTAGSVYTYHEKQKDARMSQYGSERARLGKESVTNFGKLVFRVFHCYEFRKCIYLS